MSTGSFLGTLLNYRRKRVLYRDRPNDRPSQRKPLGCDQNYSKYAVDSVYNEIVFSSKKSLFPALTAQISEPARWKLSNLTSSHVSSCLWSWPWVNLPSFFETGLLNAHTNISAFLVWLGLVLSDSSQSPGLHRPPSPTFTRPFLSNCTFAWLGMADRRKFCKPITH